MSKPIQGQLSLGLFLRKSIIPINTFQTGEQEKSALLISYKQHYKFTIEDFGQLTVLSSKK